MDMTDFHLTLRIGYRDRTPDSSFMIKSNCHLLQIIPLCFREEEPSEYEQDCIGYTEHDVVLPRYCSHSDRVDKLARNQTNMGGEICQGNSGTSQIARENLGWVGVKKRVESNIVVEEEYKEHWDDGCTDSRWHSGYELAVECSPGLGKILSSKVLRQRKA
jgi:hypothetical protein